MLKGLTGLALLLELSSSAYAFNIHNGRLIEHREWTTGPDKLQVKDIDQTRHSKNGIANRMRVHMTQGKDGIGLINKVYDQSGSIGSQTLVYGYLETYIENLNSTTSKIYTINSNFCLDLNCALTSYKIQLDPGGYFDLQTKRVLTQTFDDSGHHLLELASMVDNDELTHTFGAYDRAYLHIEE